MPELEGRMPRVQISEPELERRISRF